MYRNFDKCGRITLPKIMRKKLKFEDNGEARIELKGDKIIITNEKKQRDKKKETKTN